MRIHITLQLSQALWNFLANIVLLNNHLVFFLLYCGSGPACWLDHSKGSLKYCCSELTQTTADLTRHTHKTHTRNGNWIYQLIEILAHSLTRVGMEWIKIDLNGKKWKKMDFDGFLMDSGGFSETVLSERLTPLHHKKAAMTSKNDLEPTLVLKKKSI